MLCLRRTRWLFGLALALAALAPVRTKAQDDPNEAPLGDIARSLRKKAATRPVADRPSNDRPIIDDDNLMQVMQQADSRRGFGSSLRFLMAGESAGFRVSAPDATCSLSFTGNAKSLLSSQYAQMELAPRDVAKLDGHATIEGDALTVSVRNETDWHVSEIAVALTVIKKKTSTSGAAPVASDFSLASEVRPEKKPDITMIYRMRAAALPGITTGFSAPLDLEIVPGDEWHWALVQVKGYPPENYTAKRSKDSVPVTSVVPPPSLSGSESATSAAVMQDPRQ
jgi:hypothetical protein